MNAQDIWTREDATAEDWAAEVARLEAVKEAHNERELAVLNDIGLDYIPRWYNDSDLALAKNHGVASFRALATLDGELVYATAFDSRFGSGQVYRVCLSPEYNAPVIAWVNVSTASTVEKEQRHYRKHGFQLVWVTRRVRPDGRGFKPVYELPPISVEVLEDEPVLDLV